MQKNYSRILLLLILAFLVGGVFQMEKVTAQDDSDIYLPAIIRNWPYTPGFGVETHTFDTLSQAEAAGNHWIRYNGLLWSDVQPNHSGEWNWDTNLDADLAAANQAGMEVILIVRSTPVWAQMYPGLACGPIKQQNFANFINFMKSVVNRYSAPPYNVTHFEIWNEPDAPYAFGNSNQVWGCWGDSTDPYYGGGYYAEMLKAIYPSMKAANPRVQVVLGGLLLDCDPRHPGLPGYCATAEKAKQSRFLEGILRNGGGPYFDYINFHGYTHHSSTSSAIQSERSHPNFQANGGIIEGKLDYLNALMGQYGIVKPIIITETGYLTDGIPINDFQQKKADYVVWLYTRNLARGIEVTTWYTLDGPGWRNGGLLDADQNPLLAYIAYMTLTDALNKAEFNKDLNLGSGISGFEFHKGNKIWVLFSEAGDQKMITVPDGFQEAYDLYGNDIIPSDGQLTFSRPIYIEFIN